MLKHLGIRDYKSYRHGTRRSDFINNGAKGQLDELSMVKK